MARDKLGDYTIVREVGRGGMGAVYEARSPAGDRVAIKTMLTPPDLDSRARWEMVDRFMLEARAVRALEHKHIVSILDTGEDQGEFYIVMEFLDGQSVRQLLDMLGPISPPRALEIIRDVCTALRYAHSAGVIHRDVKPDNILILKSGVTKLTDFGLARVGEMGSNTQVGTMVGTFAYMSPEQARGEKVDARSDIFSLGVTLYEMLSGKRPFRGEMTASVLQAILMEEPEPLEGIPADIRAVVTRCLEKDPARRYPSAGELLTALEPPQEGTFVGRPAVPIPGLQAPAAPPAEPPTPVTRITAAREPAPAASLPPAAPPAAARAARLAPEEIPDAPSGKGRWEGMEEDPVTIAKPKPAAGAGRGRGAKPGAHRVYHTAPPTYVGASSTMKLLWASAAAAVAVLGAWLLMPREKAKPVTPAGARQRAPRPANPSARPDRRRGELPGSVRPGPTA